MNTNDPLFRVALAQYINMVCPFCGHKFSSIDDIWEKDPIRTEHKEFTIACKKCWDKHIKEKK